MIKRVWSFVIKVQNIKRLLFNKCMDTLEAKLNNVMSFIKVAQLIEEIKSRRQNQCNELQ
ncbi:unnamed protein product [Paramecium octaurelia]|uniref:Uncharacterized protein n=1 Tax=Paramecium octaurelia TaxID=43137 RepID=A0A8S1YLX2_PAROT|nr:unnamed protein product [Paramecium octaurelia]